MRRFFYIAYFLLIALVSFSQDNFPVKLENPIEGGSIITDRDIYCTNETIEFRYNYHYEAGLKPLSNVVYVELLSHTGKVFASQKQKLENSMVAGTINIPSDMESGNYYLKVYTRFQRNYSGSGAIYKVITILNPVVFNLSDSAYEKEDEVVFITENKQNWEDVKIISSDYQTNQKARISLEMGSGNDLKNSFAVSVIRQSSLSNYLEVLKTESVGNEKIYYIPETRGLSVSGIVKSRETDEPLEFATIWIAFTDESKNSFEIQCDNQGRFFANLGEIYNKGELFIQPFYKDTSITPEVFIDNDFDFTSRKLPFLNLNKDKYTSEQFDDFLIAAQLSSIFGTDTLIDSSLLKDTESENCFYGSPDEVVYIDKYIKLDNLKDYIKEVVPVLKLSQKDTKIKVKGELAELTLFEPLILFNQFKIKDLQQLWDLNPELVSRIEVVTSPYIRGNIVYGGIVHIISKKGGASKIKFPEESILFEYELINPFKSFSGDTAVPPNIPKVTNTLFWDSNMKFDANKQMEIEFLTGSEPGRYVIKIEGETRSNKPVVYTSSIIVN